MLIDDYSTTCNTVNASDLFQHLLLCRHNSLSLLATKSNLLIKVWITRWSTSRGTATHKRDVILM